MGEDNSKTFTEAGVKRLYQYFLINIFSILIGLFSVLVIMALYESTFDSYPSVMIAGFTIRIVFSTLLFLLALFAIWIAFSGILRISLIGTILVCYGLSIMIEFFYSVMEILVFLIMIFLLLWGVIYLFIGRKEYGKKHQILAITAFTLSIIFFVLFILKLILSAMQSNLIISANYYTDYNMLFDLQNTITIITIISAVISSLVFTLFIFDFYKRKIILIIALILGIIGPFTYEITSIFSLILFFLCYHRVYGSLESETIKTHLQVPCPFCNREIPIESKNCKYCGKTFRKFEEKI